MLRTRPTMRRDQRGGVATVFAVILSSILVVATGFWMRLQSAGEAEAAYAIANSARFSSAGSAYLNRTPGTEGNKQKWTFSAWVKRGNLGLQQYFFNATVDGNNYTSLGFKEDDGLQYLNASGGSVTANKRSNALFRDPSAWMHVVFAIDTSQAMAANRNRIYVNGVELTSFSTDTNHGSGNSTFINDDVAHYVGRDPANGVYLDGYLSDVHLIDGEALTPSSFGEYDANGYWRPKAYEGTYGTNGFKLNFSNGAALGADSSGNGNNWAVNNMSAVDQVIDTPTNGFATWNPLEKVWSGATVSPSNGNLTLDVTSGGVSESRASFYYSSPFYAEVTLTTVAGANGLVGVGVGGRTSSISSGVGSYIAHRSGTIQKFVNGSNTENTSVAPHAQGDVIGMAVNATQITYYRNGVEEATIIHGLTPGEFALIGTAYNNGHAVKLDFNFGAPGIAGTTFYSAAGGYFKYAPPAGFKALSTANLPEPAIKVPKKYFDAVTYTGTGAARSVTGSTTVMSFATIGTTTWTAPAEVTEVEYLVVGGGGGGGGNATGGGGGAGGLLTGTLSVTPGQSYSVVVGAGGGGAGASATTPGGNGGQSVFASVTAQGGGGGGSYSNGAQNGASGGSGGGGSGWPGDAAGGSGTVGQGYNGGSGTYQTINKHSSGGGGGAGAAGGAGVAGSSAGSGGNGLVSTITGTPVTYAGGGGGAGYRGSTSAGAGGSGGGGAGSANQSAGGNGTANTGGGGGGGSEAAGGTGGSGIVVIRYTSRVQFQPDLVWIKNRGSAIGHMLFDSVRGANNALRSNETTAESTYGNTLTAFGSNGFSLGDDASVPNAVNGSGHTYISWLWKKSPTAGFDIVVGAYGAGPVTHSLGSAPAFQIVKEMTPNANSWYIYHKAFGASNKVFLNTTDASSSLGGFTWVASSTQAGWTDVGLTGRTGVHYLFTEVEGFSRFGSYTGNGSADGPFIYTGFKPRYVLIKRTDMAGAWAVKDTARSPHNPALLNMLPNSSNAESSSADVDLLSNGFKLRTTNANLNTTGTYIYAAFAEQPFKYSAAPSAADYLQGAANFLMGMGF